MSYLMLAAYFVAGLAIAALSTWLVDEMEKACERERRRKCTDENS